MTVTKAIKWRRSVRSYAGKEIEDQKLLTVLKAAREAPSASNRQEWRFVVVKDERTKLLLSEAAKKQRFIAQAPVVIACCAVTDNHVMTCGQTCYPIDVAIAIDHMTLQAAELGLGTCWIGAFLEEQVKQILAIPNDVRVVGLLPIGYPAQNNSAHKERLSIEKIVFSEKWSAAFENGLLDKHK